MHIFNYIYIIKKYNIKLRNIAIIWKLFFVWNIFILLIYLFWNWKKMQMCLTQQFNRMLDNHWIWYIVSI